MEVLELVKMGSPFLLLGLCLMVIRISDQVKNIAEDVKSVKSKITWGDVCDERHDELNRRVSNLERATGLNGSVKDA